MDNAAVARRWFEEVWNQGREAAIDELLHPDGVMHGLGPPEESHRGPAGFKPFWEQMQGAFPGIRFTLHNIIADGEWVAVRWTAEATHQGDHLGVAATQKPVAVEGMGFARIVGGQIREGWNNWDQLSLTRQLGLPA